MDAGKIALALILVVGGLWLIGALIAWAFKDFTWR